MPVGYFSGEILETMGRKKVRHFVSLHKYLNPQEKQFKYGRGQSTYRGSSSGSSFRGSSPYGRGAFTKTLSRQNKQKQGDQQVKKPMSQVAEISKHLDEWQTITKDPSILDLVKNSYTIECTDWPRQETVVDSQDSPKMQTVIEELILKQAISAEETQNLIIPSFYNRFFLVDRKDGSGSRLDLSKLNNFVANESSKWKVFPF